MADHMSACFDHTGHSIDVFVVHSGGRATTSKFVTDIDTPAFEFYKRGRVISYGASSPKTVCPSPSDERVEATLISIESPSPLLSHQRPYSVHVSCYLSVSQKGHSKAFNKTAFCVEKLMKDELCMKNVLHIFYFAKEHDNVCDRRLNVLSEARRDCFNSPEVNNSSVYSSAAGVRTYYPTTLRTYEGHAHGRTSTGARSERRSLLTGSADAPRPSDTSIKLIFHSADLDNYRRSERHLPAAAELISL
ncbi:hypothetical protein EVAR_5023_1 [Eumeta japonica]|uniref:Uncharacterized protein n=1 Tax=Eumeta variegata TaxID=151549 RepID=A0A4C1SWJ0_EUMVA|nr:hypothetical protein EVAR_5023_1 [Eumeta japonica]